jgi:hypothetical protein
MRERVLAMGGRFEAGPVPPELGPGGTFRVTAALPYQPLALTGKALTRETPALEIPAREVR